MTASRPGELRRILGVVPGRDRTPLLPFEEAQRRLRPFASAYVGIRSIPLAQIVGTEGRERDFDRYFRPRHSGVSARLRRVAQAFPHSDFGAIVVYKLGDAYFVLDGHHRVAIARRRGLEWIDAEVTELRARWPLSAEADMAELLHAEQERLFLEHSRLAEARPEARIRFSLPSGYRQLLEHVQIHGYHRLVAETRPVTAAEIAAEWYEHSYLTALEAIRQEGLAEACPEATDADRVLYLHQRRRELSVELGDLPLGEAARHVAEERLSARRRRRTRPSPRRNPEPARKAA